MSAYQSLLQKIFAAPVKFGSRLRQRGLVNAIAWLLYQFQWRFREWKLGVKTREFADGIVVTDQGECHGYEPIDYRVFDIVMAQWQPISPRDGFLDYGCGMGRGVILAAQHPFGEVLGLELDATLAQIAQDNIQIARRRGYVNCRNVAIIETDARAFTVPEEVNRIFLFNSFTGEILEATLQRIYESFCRSPRQLSIAYLQPIDDHDPLSEVSWLRLEAELPTSFWSHIRSRVYVACQPPVALQDEAGDGF